MLTTVPEHTAELSITRDKKNGRDVMKPQCVFDYNDAKKGVDYSDQMSSYYSPLRETKKWYKKAAFELLLGTSVVNACILYSKYVHITHRSQCLSRPSGNPSFFIF